MSWAAIPLLAFTFLAPAQHQPPAHHHRHCHHHRRCRVTVVTFTSPGSGTWLAPAGVTSISVAVWGAGGGGQAGSFASGGTGGNAGGGAEHAAESSVAVTPGVLYKWTVGVAGLGATASQPSTAGGTSSFAAGTLTITGHGGDRGGGDGQGGHGSGNTTHFNGGNGGNGFSGGPGAGGGGGASAGTAAAGGNGGNATISSPGSGGTAPAGGGQGGQGGASPTSAVNGSAPGGGGGGGGSGVRNNGGNGANGQVEITYTAPQQPQVPAFPAGYAPTPDDFANWVTNPLAFLTSKIAFRGVCGSAMALAANTNVVLPMTVLEDPMAGWQSGASQWLAPQSGLYSVSLTTSCAANSNQPVLAAKVGLNSQAQTFTLAKAWVPPASVPGLASGSVLQYLYGGQDSVQGIAEAIGAAGTVAAATGQNPRLSIMWVSE
jgi:hypothetical protein